MGQPGRERSLGKEGGRKESGATRQSNEGRKKWGLIGPIPLKSKDACGFMHENSRHGHECFFVF